MSQFESIYNLVPREYHASEKPRMHKSCYDPKAPLTGSTFGCKGTSRLLGAGTVTKHDGALFGPKHDPSGEVVPVSYLRKALPTEKPRARPASDYAKRKANMRAGIPSQEDRPVMGIYTSKNYVTANAVEAILQAPRIVETGNPNYLKKEDFGKVPTYLKQVKEEIRRENDMIDKYVKEQMGVQDKDPEQLDEMNENDRRCLLQALKTKWNAVNANYQKMTHLIDLDTIGQVRRKENLENSLKQLESDIERLERAGPVLIR